MKIYCLNIRIHTLITWQNYKKKSNYLRLLSENQNKNINFAVKRSNKPQRAPCKGGAKE